jgi:hypothetical protein
MATLESRAIRRRSERPPEPASIEGRCWPDYTVTWRRLPAAFRLDRIRQQLAAVGNEGSSSVSSKTAECHGERDTGLSLRLHRRWSLRGEERHAERTSMESSGIYRSLLAGRRSREFASARSAPVSRRRDRTSYAVLRFLSGRARDARSHLQTSPPPRTDAPHARPACRSLGSGLRMLEIRRRTGARR